MTINPFVNCTQSMSILDDLVQKVRFSTNTRTTSLICVLSNCIISGLVDEKKNYTLLRHMQGFRLQPDQCRILYAFLTHMAMLALFLLLMARVTLATTLHLNLEFDFLLEVNVTMATLSIVALVLLATILLVNLAT